MTLASPIHPARPVRIVLEVALLVLLSAIWGSSFTLIKIAVGTVPPLTITAARLAIAAALLVLYALTRGLAFPRSPGKWAELVVQGLLQSAIPFALISWGETRIESGLAGVLNATPPMFVLLIAILSGRASGRVTPRKVAGVFLGLVGVAVTIGFQSVTDIGSAAPLAQTAVLAASLCYALAAIWGQRFSAFDPAVTAASAMSCAAITVLPAALLIDHPWRLSPAPEALIAILVLALLCTAFAMIIFFRLVNTLGPLGTSSGSYLRAGFAVLLGVVFLKEGFTWSAAAGMAMIIAGVIAITLPQRVRAG